MLPPGTTGTTSQVMSHDKPSYWTENACSTWDATLPFDKQMDRKKFHKTVCEFFKAYAYQLEQGETTDYKHYQFRGSLKVKQRGQEIKKKLTAAGWVFGKLSVTSKENRENHFYTTKEDTRIEGPWTDKDGPEPILTERVKVYDHFGPKRWQQQALDLILPYDMRIIHWIICKAGDSGKTTLSDVLEYHHGWHAVMPYRLMEDICNVAMETRWAKGWVFDIPREMKGLSDMILGLEKLKDGKAADKRNKYRFHTWEKAPSMVVLSNIPPKLNSMSKNRWKIWEIIDEELVPFIEDRRTNEERLADIEAQEAAQKAEDAEREARRVAKYEERLYNNALARKRVKERLEAEAGEE